MITLGNRNAQFGGKCAEIIFHHNVISGQFTPQEYANKPFTWLGEMSSLSSNKRSTRAAGTVAKASSPRGAERIRSQNNDFLLNMGRFVPAVRVYRTQSKGSTPVHVSQASFLLFGNFAPKCWANGDRRKHFERLYHLNGERYPCGYYCTLI